MKASELYFLLLPDILMLTNMKFDILKLLVFESQS